jgi:hypothetical protein
MAIGQFPPLVKPHALAAREPVHEDHRWTASRNAVRKLDVADTNAVSGGH